MTGLQKIRMRGGRGRRRRQDEARRAADDCAHDGRFLSRASSVFVSPASAPGIHPGAEAGEFEQMWVGVDAEEAGRGYSWVCGLRVERFLAPALAWGMKRLSKPRNRPLL